MMRTRRGWMGALVGALALWAAPAVAQVTITIDSDVEPADGQAVVNVSVAGGGATVGGMQNDIIFDNTIVNLSRAAECRINAAIGLFPGGDSCLDDSTIGPCKNLSSVLNTCGGTPQAEGCPSGAGTNISVFRGIIAATAAPNNNAIPDGPLYTCTFDVVNAEALPAALEASNVVVSDPVGTRLDSTGVDGSIGEGGATPTNTPDTGPTPTVPPGGALISIGTDPGTGETALVDVSLATDGASVGGMQNDIIFDNTVINLARAAECRINAAIGLFPDGGSCLDDSTIGPCKNLSSVLNTCGGTPQAEGCPAGAGTNISVFRGIIAATAAPNNNVIPDGVLYTCTFNVVNAGALPTVLTGSNQVVSDPFGTRLTSAVANGGVGEGPSPTATPDVSPTDTPVPPTNTPVPPTDTPAEPTSTQEPTATATTGTGEECVSTLANAAAVGNAAITLVDASCFPAGGGTIQIGTTQPRGYVERVGNQLFLVQSLSAGFPAGTVVTLIRGGGDDDDGCHINAKATNSNAWLLLIPAVGLLALRRKQW